jgi:hypothetical protein
MLYQKLQVSLYKMFSWVTKNSGKIMAQKSRACLVPQCVIATTVLSLNASCQAVHNTYFYTLHYIERTGAIHRVS